MTQSDALSILKTGVNVFLTGKPGSGKTHTVNEYIAWQRACGIEPGITASTGIAATHIHGMTIHSWSGIGIRDHLSPMDLDAISEKEHIVRRIQKTSTLIIDEVSMLSADVLTMVDMVCQEIRHSTLPFGGIQVVLVGDFFQLPPISKRGGPPAPFAFEASAWNKLHFLVCYLTEQHRQDDDRFLSVLDSIREGEVDPTTVSTIMARETDASELDDDIPRLFTHNVDVDRINSERLEGISSTTKRYVMNGTGAPLLIEGLKRGCLSPELLLLKEGAIVMGTKNIPQIGIANGTLGTVVGFERGSDLPIIETHGGRTITIPLAEWAVEENGRARATISQIPLRLAWAITVHKSQGMSMDSAAIDLSRAFEYGQGYVALSRVRSLAGLHIVGWSEEALMVHPKVRSKDEQFRELSEEGERAYAALEASGERTEMEMRFVKASGGSIPSKKELIQALSEERKPIKVSIKKDTYLETMNASKEAKSIKELAASRGLTVGTICTHLEKLAASGKIDVNDIKKLLSKKTIASLPVIHAVFDAHKSSSLSAAFENLQPTYTYDDIRFARLVYVP
jgi:ATP-dependent DNA helicase PIF1